MAGLNIRIKGLLFKILEVMNIIYVSYTYASDSGIRTYTYSVPLYNCLKFCNVYRNKPSLYACTDGVI